MGSRVLLVVFTFLLICNVGCQPNTEPLERTASQGFDIVQTALGKAVDETSTRTAALQGNLTGVEPGWTFEGYGIFGTGIIYKGTIFAKGVSGTLMGHTQADAGQAGVVPPPAIRTQPE